MATRRQKSRADIDAQLDRIKKTQEARIRQIKSNPWTREGQWALNEAYKHGNRADTAAKIYKMRMDSPLQDAAYKASVEGLSQDIMNGEGLDGFNSAKDIREKARNEKFSRSKRMGGGRRKTSEFTRHYASDYQYADIAKKHEVRRMRNASVGANIG